MANKKITDLTALSATPAVGDLFELVDVSDTTDGAGGTSKKTTYAEVTAGLKNYDYVVASSGGTHTTLRGALAVAGAGNTILVMDGTTESGSITSSLNDITIVGTGQKGATVAMASYSFTLSGTGVTVDGLGLSFSTGSLILSGANARLLNCNITATDAPTSNNGHVQLNSTDGVINGLTFLNSKASATSKNSISLLATRCSLLNSNIQAPGSASASPSGSTVYMGQTDQIVSNNFITNTKNEATICIGFDNNNATISNNNLVPNNTANAYCIYGSGSYYTISGNNFNSGTRQVYMGGTGNIVGNKFTVSSSSYGIYCASAATSSYLCITGNYFNIGSSAYGIYLHTDGVCNTITGNYFVNGGTGIYLHGKYHTVVGNGFYFVTTSINVQNKMNTIANNTGTLLDLQQTATGNLMKNTSGGALSAGQVVVLKASTGGAQEVTTTTTQGDPLVLGISGEAPANNASGWIATSGYVGTLKVNGTADIALGDLLACYTSAGIAYKAQAGDTAFAIALGTYATDDSNGTIDCLLIPPRKV